MAPRALTVLAIVSVIVIVWNRLCNLRRKPNMIFRLFPIGDQLPRGYRLVTIREVHDHPEALTRAMPGWEIANLADGSVDGLEYGGHTKLERRNDVGHNLVTHDQTLGSMQHDPLYDSTQQDPMEDPYATQVRSEMTFRLFPIGDQLPRGYRLVTIREVHDHPEALTRAMPGWEIANLADGSVDGLEYGGHTRLERRNDVGHNLVTHDQTLGSMQHDPLYDSTQQDPMEDPYATQVRSEMTFRLFPIGDQLPRGYRLVTIREVHDHREALKREMPGWEIANLADGSVDGFKYGARTRLERRNDVGHNLATRSELVKNSCTSSISCPATSEYFSPSIVRMKELMNRPGVDKVEAEIEASKDHWTELTSNEQDFNASTSERPSGPLGLPDEQLFENHLMGQEWKLKTNQQLFQCLEKGEWNSYSSKKTPPEVQANLNFHLLKEDWSRSFVRMDGSTALADKPFAAGGQAEIFLENPVNEESDSNMGLSRHVLKVFRMNKALQDLLRDEIPRAMLKQNVRIGGRPSERNCRHRCNIMHIVLLDDGRFAFRMPLYGGDLRKFICERKMQDNNGAPFSDDVATLCMLQIAMAMEDLHSDGIIHNDLKASNVLISNTLTGSEPVTREYPLFCWVADFECSIGTMGTGFWRAPEVLMHEPKLEDFTKASDVYSYGMTCYEILTGLTPFEYERHAKDSYEVVHRGDRPKVPSDIKPWIKVLLEKCWHQTPSRRPTFEQIVKIIVKEEPSSRRSLFNLLRGSH